MNTRLFKSFVQNKKEDQHIPAIAGTLFGVFLVIAILGAVFADGRFSDAVIGTWVIVWTFIGS